MKFISVIIKILKIVIEYPKQFTIVRAEPLFLEATFWATKVENMGESPITKKLHIIKNTINRVWLSTSKQKGAIKQQRKDPNKKIKAIFFLLIFEKYTL